MTFSRIQRLFKFFNMAISSVFAPVTPGDLQCSDVNKTKNIRAAITCRGLLLWITVVFQYYFQKNSASCAWFTENKKGTCIPFCLQSLSQSPCENFSSCYIKLCMLWIVDSVVVIVNPKWNFWNLDLSG